jgi:hypothetical protein
LLDPRLGEDGTPLEGDDEEDIFKNRRFKKKMRFFMFIVK